jgi:hypothetical protein
MPVGDPGEGDPILNPLIVIENGLNGLMKPPDAIVIFWICKHEVQGAEMLTGMESKVVWMESAKSWAGLVASINDWHDATNCPAGMKELVWSVMIILPDWYAEVAENWLIPYRTEHELGRMETT